jgi:hypothetical protein
MRVLRRLTAIALVVLGSGLVAAAREPAAPAAPVRTELLVLEVRDCTICALVRLKVQPLYEQSAHARQVPMRFVDITHMDERRLGLREGVRTVPTIVLMRDGEEVDRITGYLAPDDTLRLLSHLIGSLD